LQPPASEAQTGDEGPKMKGIGSSASG